MTAIPRKSILVGTALVLIVILSVAFSAPPERKYKNLKVLPKNISEKDLDSVMHVFTRGLGVRCDFCHVPAGERKIDFVSDEKPEKNIARKMMKMTRKINKKYFDYAKDDQGKDLDAMTCYSCHHGEPHPSRNPPPRPNNAGAGQPGNAQPPKQ